MPPKKKCTHKARKAELVFLEKPRAGPIHCYEAPLHLAENPRRVPTKPVDLNTSAAWLQQRQTVPMQQSSSPREALFKYYCCLDLLLTKQAQEVWFQTCMKHSFVPVDLQVCPQFDTTKPVVLKARQKKHRGPQQSYNQDASHSSFHAGGACRGAVACRFPPLTFENPEGHAVPLLEDPNCLRKNAQCSPNQPKKVTAANANIQVKSPENCGEPAPRPVEQEVPNPSDAEAAKVPSPRNGRCGNILSQSSHAWHPEEELPLGIDPRGRGEEAAVLVADTPEHEYGIKVTWRRRPHVMKYLREQGKLSAADILVKANVELSRRQAHT